MKHPVPALVFLGLEGGGTRTSALWTDAHGVVLRQASAGPANLRLCSDAQLIRHFRGLAGAGPHPSALGIGLAGARTAADGSRILRAAARVWPGVPCHATNDLETALLAADFKESAGRRLVEAARVLVLSGTGSCCFGRAVDGATVKVGGWGHLLGDKGSGYEIGLRALKATLFRYDRDGVWPGLGRRILRAVQLNEPNDLIGWAQNAGKADIAALAIEVFAAWSAKDKIAADILAGASASLARDAAACARRLVKAGTPVRFVLAGSVLLKQPRFARQVARQLRELWPIARIAPLARESVWGAVELARRHFGAAVSIHQPPVTLRQPSPSPRVESRELSPTERRHPLSMNLDRMPLREAIALMLREDEKIPAALRAERVKIERGVRLIVRAFRQGGRLFYVGAGTSGRLGVLDASECPPTFRTEPEMVQGVIAGGQQAIWSAVEGAEDDAVAGGRALDFRGVNRRDVVVGIAASGRTPFVWGALAEAKRRGAATMLLCFNPHLSIPRALRPTLVLAPKIGPEILTGSTRLKAGTATKLILNLFTTLAMVRLGKVLGNLMIDVKASNTKLRDRAARIVRELTGAEYAVAERALGQTGWKIKEACRRLGRK